MGKRRKCGKTIFGFQIGAIRGLQIGAGFRYYKSLQKELQVEAAYKRQKELHKELQMESSREYKHRT